MHGPGRYFCNVRLLSSLATISASTDALGDRATTIGGAAINDEPAAGRRTARAAIAAVLVADVTRGDALAAAGVKCYRYRTCLAVTGGAALAAAGRAALANDRAAVAASWGYNCWLLS